MFQTGPIKHTLHIEIELRFDDLAIDAAMSWLWTAPETGRTSTLVVPSQTQSLCMDEGCGLLNLGLASTDPVHSICGLVIKQARSGSSPYLDVIALTFISGTGPACNRPNCDDIKWLTAGIVVSKKVVGNFFLAPVCFC
jgi:hypothetical protein